MMLMDVADVCGDVGVVLMLVVMSLLLVVVQLLIADGCLMLMEA